jgi:flagellar biosynthesis repressor protein FlbT
MRNLPNRTAESRYAGIFNRSSGWAGARGAAMALRVVLKPGERIIVGQSLITNSDSRATFLIDGQAPILREKDILTAETANTPVKRLYLCIQLMYLEDDIPKYQDLYMGFVKDLLEAVPSFRASIEAASKLILSGSLYNSLKEIRKLFPREEELLRR